MSSVPEDEKADDRLPILEYLHPDLHLPQVVVSLDELPKGTLRMSPAQYRMRLRWGFLKELLGRRRLQNLIVAEWRPRWRSIPDEDRFGGWFEDLAGDLDYVRTLRAFVEETLTCRENDKPARWLLRELHNVIIGGQPFSHGTITQGTFYKVGVEIIVHTSGGAIVTEMRPDGSLPTIGVGGPYGMFSAWDQLRQQAHAALERVLEDTRLRYEDATADYTGHHVSRLNEIAAEDMARLIDYLWDGKRTSGNRHKRRRLIADLGLDSVRRN